MPGGSIGPKYVLKLMFCENHTIVNTPQTPDAREKISAYLESLEFWKIFDVCFTKFENYQILLNTISHRFQVTRWQQGFQIYLATLI